MSHPSALSDDRTWLCWSGIETDLIFNKGIDLPHFAAFPMIDSAEGRARLTGYYAQLIEIGRQTGVGIVLDAPTWMANPDRAAPVGYAASDMPRVTRDAVALARGVAQRHPDVATRVSVQIGPQADGYEAGRMTATDAARYHAPQIEAAQAAGADLVSAFTLGAIGEALGIAQSARASGIPAVVSYTVETDGRLADGTPLSEAVTRLADEGAPAAILVNCAHPDHIAEGLDGGAWEGLLSGVVVNASRQSHAELDAAEVLDDGDPQELSTQIHALHQSHGLRLVGGCCGTDLRHMGRIAHAVGPQRHDTPKGHAV